MRVVNINGAQIHQNGFSRLVLYDRASSIPRPIPFARDVNKSIPGLPNFGPKILHFIASANAQPVAVEALYQLPSLHWASVFNQYPASVSLELFLRDRAITV